MNTQRKNFERAFRLHAACTISEMRPELAYITFRKGYAYASDGHMAARAKLSDITSFHPDELKLLEGKAIHMDNFRRLLNYAVANITDAGFEVNDQGRRLLIYFADQQTIMFDHETSEIFDAINVTNSMSVYKLGVSAQQLRKASMVLGDDTLRLDYYDNGHGSMLTHIVALPNAADAHIVIFDQIMNWK